MNQPNRVCYNFNNSGIFACVDLDGANDQSSAVVLGDMNGDGIVDAIFANRNERNKVCYRTGAVLFSCADLGTDTNTSRAVALVFDGVFNDGFESGDTTAWSSTQ